MSRSISCVLGALALLGLSVQVEAQVDGPDPSWRGLFVGAAVGSGVVPVTFFDACVLEDRYDSRSNSISAGLSVGVPVGPLVMESHTTATRQLVLGAQDDCGFVEPVHESGVHVDRLRGLETGAFTTTDLRLRYEGPPGYPIVASAGAGWAWTHDLPFWSASVGVRTAGRVRWGMDIAWGRYRMPFHDVRREWENFDVVRELSRETDHEWQSAWSLRFGVEWHLG